MAPNTRANVHSGGSMLAESDNVSVFQCSCGNIHLQIGSVCLTMQPEELNELSAVMHRAMLHGAGAQPAAATAVN